MSFLPVSKALIYKEAKKNSYTVTYTFFLNALSYEKRK